ncbi:hypothetical protein MJD09_24865, partial [bacterium]|nr:hypothetical protein [bacterium]
FGGFWGEPWSFPSVDEPVGLLSKLFNVLAFNIVHNLTGVGGGFLTILALPSIPDINVAPGSPYEGYFGFTN